MNSERLDAFVDGYTFQVLGTLDSISVGNRIDPEELFSKLCQILNRAKTFLDQETWQYAVYPLVSWTDECLLDADWSGKGIWENRLLESELFGTRVCSERFFVFAEQVANQRHDLAPSLLRIYFECVMMGFRGIYAFRSEAAYLESLKLPVSLDHWCELQKQRLDAHAQSAIASPSESSSGGRTLTGAPPLRHKHRVVWWAMAVIAMLIVNGVLLALNGWA